MLKQKLEQEVRTVADFPLKGISFKDITPIFKNTELCKELIAALVQPFYGKVDVVCGIESRGFLFGLPLALALDVPFVLIRKEGKLPPPVVGELYEMEYGTTKIEMIEGQLDKGQRILIHDDVLATGGTVLAATKLIEKQEATVAGFSFILELSFLSGAKKLASFDAEVHSLLSYNS